MALRAVIDTSTWDALYARVTGRQKNLALGVFGDEELATIAASNEFGTETIPERSYIRATLNGERDAFREALVVVSRALLTGRMSQDQALARLGALGVKLIQRRIRSNIPPPLKPATIARKGSSKALIDTGRLINSIAWKVVP